jgi:mevalonate kinase
VHGACAIAAAISKRVRVSISEAPEDSYLISGNAKSKINDDDGRFILAKTILRCVLEEKKSKNHGVVVSVSSDLPAGSGLGSSAAVSVATAAAALKFSGLDSSPKKIFEIALSGEKKVHGNPSGIDVETSLQGGLLLFSRNAGSKSIPLNRVVHFLVVYSGKPRRTSTLIDKVESKRKQFPNFFDCLTRSASFLSLEVVDALTAGDLPRLGALMCISQATLSWIGVSTTSIDRLIENISAQEVFGAKLTGAGGGGSIIALPKPESVDKISKYISRNYAYSFVTQVPQEGLRWES